MQGAMAKGLEMEMCGCHCSLQQANQLPSWRHPTLSHKLSHPAAPIQLDSRAFSLTSFGWKRDSCSTVCIEWVEAQGTTV